MRKEGKRLRECKYYIIMVSRCTLVHINAGINANISNQILMYAIYTLGTRVKRHG